MTPIKFLTGFFNIKDDRSEVATEIALCDLIESSNGDIDQMIRIMEEYARIMCDRQRQLCEFHAESKTLKHNGQSYTTIDSASIRNSPLPEELR